MNFIIFFIKKNYKMGNYFCHKNFDEICEIAYVKKMSNYKIGDKLKNKDLMNSKIKLDDNNCKTLSLSNGKIVTIHDEYINFDFVNKI